MSTMISCPTLIISIVPSEDFSQFTFCEKKMPPYVSQLRSLFERYQLVATWALPTYSVPCLDLVELGHELALPCESDWTQSDVGRSDFAQALSRMLDLARVEGQTLSTLVLDAKSKPNYTDLLVKRGITAIARATRTLPTLPNQLVPKQIRWGLWQMPAAHTFPVDTGRWKIGAGIRSVDRPLLHSLQNHRIAHLSIVFDKLVRCGSWELCETERVLKQIARRRDAGEFEDKTIASVTDMLTPDRKARSTQSILRRVA